MHELEYDPAKSQANLKKHGIDFEHAQELWGDPYMIQIDARTVDEPRTLVIGAIRNKLWSAIITYRNGATRIISVRRARKSEESLYES